MVSPPAQLLRALGTSKIIHGRLLSSDGDPSSSLNKLLHRLGLVRRVGGWFLTLSLFLATN